MKTYKIYALIAIFLASIASYGNDHASKDGVSADSALKMLMEGNQRFVSDQGKHLKQDDARRKELSGGQKPHTIVLSCSDSRVPPELIFDQGLGEIFVIRVAGNILGAATVASIEYAVEHLGSKLILVMGHDSCGAVKAALSTPMGKSAGSADLDTLVATIQPNLEGLDYKKELLDAKVHVPVQMNVNGVAKQLVKRSAIVRKAVASGGVKIVRSVYSLDSGRVEFWTENTN